MRRGPPGAAAWIERAARLVQGRPDCAQRAYLLLAEAERQVRDGDEGAAFATAERAAELGARCADPDVVGIAVHLQGGHG
jgi:hypothetical protein